MAYCKFTIKAISIISIILVMLGINAKDNLVHNSSSSPSCGNPIISEEYSLYEELSVDQIVDDEKYLYVLLGDHDGVVQIFDHDGKHIITAKFYKHMNGAFRIAAQDGFFYVRDYQFNIYVFQDGRFSFFLEKNEANDIIENVDFNQNSANYDEHSGSIWRVADNVEVVTRPIKSQFINTNTLFYLSIILVLAIGCIKKYKVNMF